VLTCVSRSTVDTPVTCIKPHFQVKFLQLLTWSPFKFCAGFSPSSFHEPVSKFLLNSHLLPNIPFLWKVLALPCTPFLSWDTLVLGFAVLCSISHLSSLLDCGSFRTVTCSPSPSSIPSFCYLPIPTISQRIK
jgi:hypothetical protein